MYRVKQERKSARERKAGTGVKKKIIFSLVVLKNYYPFYSRRDGDILLEREIISNFLDEYLIIFFFRLVLFISLRICCFSASAGVSFENLLYSFLSTYSAVAIFTYVGFYTHLAFAGSIGARFPRNYLRTSRRVRSSSTWRHAAPRRSCSRLRKATRMICSK